MIGKRREKLHTCVHGQHGLCLLDLGGQLVLLGTDITKMGPCGLQAAMSYREEAASVARSSTQPSWPTDGVRTKTEALSFIHPPPAVVPLHTTKTGRHYTPTPTHRVDPMA